MADNALKLPIIKTVAVQAVSRAQDQVQITGKSIPCHVVAVNGAMITVAFDVKTSYPLQQVTIPLFGPIYIRYPIQVGDKGAAIAFDVSLANQAGLGGGVPPLPMPGAIAQAGNLGSSLVFLPFANTDWATVDPNAVVVYGPNGVVLRDTASHSIITLTPSAISIVTQNTGTITIDNGVNTITLSPSGYTITGTTGLIQGTTELTLEDGTNFITPAGLNAWWLALYTWLSTHEHSGVTTGGGDTGYPTTDPPLTSPAPAV